MNVLSGAHGQLPGSYTLRQYIAAAAEQRVSIYSVLTLLAQSSLSHSSMGQVGSCAGMLDLQELEDELANMRQELMAAREVAARASSTWDKFRKERDFHRMHHKRVAQEKNKLISDIKRLKVQHWGWPWQACLPQLSLRHASLL